MIEKIMLLFSN